MTMRLSKTFFTAIANTDALRSFLDIRDKMWPIGESQWIGSVCTLPVVTSGLL
jgi:hypothetical protein